MRQQAQQHVAYIGYRQPPYFAHHVDPTPTAGDMDIRFPLKVEDGNRLLRLRQVQVPQ
jgi:hypothetical protein